MSEEKLTQVEKTANELGISVSKIEAVVEDDAVITVPKKKSKPKVSVEPETVGTINEEEKPKKIESKKNKVALYSSRNVFWEGVGEVKRGYNFVTEEQADKWLTRIHIRLVTPEEIKEAFDN
jgi:YbbR domain-containing protein